MILRITIIGLLAGVIGTGLGGIISALFKRNVDRYLDFFIDRKSTRLNSSH